MWSKPLEVELGRRVDQRASNVTKTGSSTPANMTATHWFFWGRMLLSLFEQSEQLKSNIFLLRVKDG